MTGLDALRSTMLRGIDGLVRIVGICQWILLLAGVLNQWYKESNSTSVNSYCSSKENLTEIANWASFAKVWMAPKAQLHSILSHSISVQRNILSGLGSLRSV